MATIKPFKAVRPAKELAHDVAALPYDVMNEAEAREMVMDKPHSFLHVDRSEVDLPLGTDVHSQEVYEKAAATMNKMITDGVFITDDKPCFYIYQLTMDGRNQTGLVATTSVDEYIDGTIKKHEFTRKDKEEDRINHVDYCDANTGPIFLAYKGTDAANKIIADWMLNHSAEYDFIADDAISHRVWVVDDQETCAALVEIFAGISNFYIADGHHRNASACAVALKRREQYPHFDGTEEFNYYLSVLFPASELKILDYNRVVMDLNGHETEDFMAAVSESFTISKFEGFGCFAPTKKGEFGMFLEGVWYVLEVKAEKVPTDVVGSLDVALLQNLLLTPILDIDDPRTNKRIDFVGGIRGLGELEKRVGEGAKVAFSMYPTSLDELMNVADSGNVMPPKSTWFEPKLRSGLFIHKLSD